MMKNIQRLSLISALCVVLLLATSPALAADPVEIPPWCGDVQVPADTPIVLRWFWAADSEKLVNDFLDSGRYFLKISNRPVANTAGYWGEIGEWMDYEPDGDMDYWVVFEYPLKSLEVGETYELFSLYILRDEITDGIWPEMLGPGPLGPIHKPPWRCTITAVKS